MKIDQLLAEKPDTDVEIIRPDATLRQAAQKLAKFNIGALVVSDDTRDLKGIISERDLVQVVASTDPAAAEQPVSSVMTRDVITCTPNDEIAYILRLMNANAIRHMPVLYHGKLANMVSIRELTTAYELLQIEANTDPLTELSNRRPFLRTLATEFDRALRFGHAMTIAMIDIDHFKRVNDTYGHDAGDTVLRAFSNLLITQFRTIDLIGRLGGEEFAVLFPETDLAGADIACRRLLGDVQATQIAVGDANVQITASIGLAAASAGKSDGLAILKRADELLYDAKEGGRNQVVIENG